MAEHFRMEIAGVAAEIAPLCESTRHYFSQYLTQREGEFSFSVTREAMEFEQAFALEEARQEGIRPRIYDAPHLERAAIQRAFAEQLLGLDTLLVHGSAVAVDGESYLFTAKCGTGKSTHTRLWRQMFGDRAVMVNDDKPFLKLTDGAAFACGSPWGGKHGLHSNVCLPLKGICILERGGENVIHPISAESAMEMLLRQSYCPVDLARMEQRAALVARLARMVPLWWMECTKDVEAAAVSYAAMSQRK